jgi:1-deoxy-D-xylulose-5-phosphate reductoisomerase
LSGSRRIVLLGSTGSIGTQAIDVVRAAAGRFTVTAIAAGGADPSLIAAQAAELRVSVVGVSREEAVDELNAELAWRWPGDVPAPRVVAGPGAVAEVAALACDMVLNGVAGALGLRATIAALKAGNVVGLANKESLVAGGPLVTGLAAPGQLVAVDSEHSALAQCLRSGTAEEVAKLILTASGGPFRGRSRESLRGVSPQQALAHPTWDMGRLVTTNSATLVNKGLEMIEAHLLFDVPYDRIAVVIHPQSIVHSMVEFTDGSTIAQASPPDMRLPIALAMGWPQRVPGAARAVDWSRASSWSFEPLDDVAFPAFELARTVGIAGGCAPAVYNGANEELVASFHEGHIGFLAIVDTLELVVAEWLSAHHGSVGNPGTVEDVEQADGWARARARVLATSKPDA